MNKLNTIISFTALVLAIAIGVMHFTAKQKIAFVDNVKLVNNYEGIKAAKAVIEKQSKSMQARVDTLEMELTGEFKNYEKERKGMTKKEMQLTEELLRKKQQDFMQYREIIVQKIKEEEAKLTQEALMPVDEFIKEYGKKHGHKIIIGSNSMGNVLFVDEAIDLTDEILEKVNKQYKENK